MVIGTNAQSLPNSTETKRGFTLYFVVVTTVSVLGNSISFNT